MSIVTSRFSENARIKIDYNKCKACGRCTQVCKDFSLIIRNGKLEVSENPLFGCMGCGQCVAVCPNDAIMVEGRDLTKESFYELGSIDESIQYHSLLQLMQRRRSVRDFKNKNVEKELVDKIINAAVTAPMGIPPSDVHVMTLHGRENVNRFSRDFVDNLKKFKWMFSPFFLKIMKPFIGKANYDLFKSFIIPLMSFFPKSMEKGNNYLLYDAPLSLYFYGSPYCDPIDPIIPATYAMLAAESLGLASCMIGSIHPFLIRMPRLMQKYHIRQKSREGIFVIFGYPKYEYHKGIKRSFAMSDIISTN